MPEIEYINSKFILITAMKENNAGEAIANSHKKVVTINIGL